MDIKQQIINILESSKHEIKRIKPSVWAGSKRVMSTEVSPWAGKFSFDRTPYLVEVLNTISTESDAHTVAVMKSAQIGFSTGVIENALGYIIDVDPANTLLLTGHSDLAEEAMTGKVDNMIDSCNLRPLIRPSTLRKKNMRSGDTNKSKEFPGGSIIAGSANHKLLRQRSVRYIFVDDFDAMKGSTKESGSTTQMIEQRAAAHSKRKIYYISTPEVKQTSNIEPVYLLGDQRKYQVPCPICGDFITLEWSITIDKKTYGITYERDEKGDYVEGSTGYTCQSCGGFFTDKKKREMLINGFWKPTAKPSQPGYYSYHISALYAPVGAFDWEHYVRQFIQANPKNAPVKMKQMQTFTNLVLGETWEERGETPKANYLQRNQRDYEIDTIPETLSIQDGNGSIVLLTCASDLNGTEDDARLDYEILAWSESGANYSVKHGSIGTFIPNESHKKVKKDRKKWTYRNNANNNVWEEFDKIIEKIYITDTDRKIKIHITGVDTGHYTNFAYSYIDYSQNHVVALKGDKINKYRKLGIDTPTFKYGKERSNLFLIEVNQIKDDLAEFMKLRWDKVSNQPPQFMNFPIPSSGLYTYKDFYSHFEAEHRILEKSKEDTGVAARWVKIRSTAQNHLWDCRVYNIALKDIIVDMFGKANKIKHFGYFDFVKLIKNKK